MITALAGGVGAARFLSGLVQVVEPAAVTAVVNTGDDDTFHGLRVCPDLDSVTYRLAGADNPETGWGLAGETFTTIGALERFGAPTWFRLGDQDLATHIYRTERLQAGASLTEVTAEIASAWNLTTRILPMTDDPVRTRIAARVGDQVRDFAMQEWFVREHAEPPVTGVTFDGAADARPTDAVMAALTDADTVVVCPSNPLISIGPILAVPGIHEALVAARERVVAVSPLISGKAVKGPADKMMASLGHDTNCLGVARLYAPWCATIVIDHADEEHIPAIEALGMRVVATDTLMRDARVAAALAESTLAAAR